MIFNWFKEKKLRHLLGGQELALDTVGDNLWQRMDTWFLEALGNHGFIGTRIARVPKLHNYDYLRELVIEVDPNRLGATWGQ